MALALRRVLSGSRITRSPLVVPASGRTRTAIAGDCSELISVVRRGSPVRGPRGRSHGPVHVHVHRDLLDDVSGCSLHEQGSDDEAVDMPVGDGGLRHHSIGDRSGQPESVSVTVRAASDHRGTEEDQARASGLCEESHCMHVHLLLRDECALVVDPRRELGVVEAKADRVDERTSDVIAQCLQQVPLSQASAQRWAERCLSRAPPQTGRRTRMLRRRWSSRTAGASDHSQFSSVGRRHARHCRHDGRVRRGS